METPILTTFTILRGISIPISLLIILRLLKTPWQD